LEHNSYNDAEKSSAKSETYDLSILMVLATVVWNSIHKLIRNAGNSNVDLSHLESFVLKN
jgi:hypothetical protein